MAKMATTVRQEAGGGCGTNNGATEEPEWKGTRQFGIWRSRVFREIEKCADLGSLCPGATLHEAHVDESEGLAIARFRCFVPFREGSSALEMIPLVALDVEMPFAHADPAPQFPFRAPLVQIASGAEMLPRELRLAAIQDDRGDSDGSNGGVALAPGGDRDNRRWCLRLPSLERWSPSHTLVMLLQDFVAAVQQDDPQPSATAATVSSPSGRNESVHGGRAAKRLRMHRRDIHGAIYQCQEVDTRTGTLCAVPMLLQSGNIVLLVPRPNRPKSATTGMTTNRAFGTNADDDYIYVSDLFPLRDIARITPQRGKSITFFFKHRQMRCRTLLTPQTEAIVSDIQRMIAAVGAKRAREDDQGGRHYHHEESTGDGSGSFSQLLSFLTPEQSEKAKEVSNKIVGKLSRWGSSVSKFFKGEEQDDGSPDRHRGSSATSHDQALREIEQLKAQFYRYPSRARMVEITTRYQSLAEAHAQKNSRDGRVEHVVEGLQAFIEHPTSQRILLETAAAESSNKGIRVGSSSH